MLDMNKSRIKETNRMPIKKDRGKFLTIVLVISSITIISGFFGLLNRDYSSFSSYYNVSKPFLEAYSWFFWFLGLISIVGIWLWKRWAVFLRIATSILTFLVQVFYLGLPGIKWYKFFILLLIPLAISLTLELWSIFRKWKCFE